eukprot:TRINITY_DN26274_c0_g1_i1.p1 TRINITY_DN26274_c0_g1~~TRINITY_DN26274_c0_g1_i1.p1  ORF type:complete len:143 (+),score=22.90 TRINITY_DN26274_c0_g1_i1:43-471(+)
MPLYKTIPTREQYLVRRKGTGQCYIIEGPNEVNTFRKDFERLHPTAASERQFIYIEELSGAVKHIPGPSLVFFNPIVHRQVLCKDGIALDASSAVVVYKQVPESEEVEQRVVVWETQLCNKTKEGAPGGGGAGGRQGYNTGY